MTDPLDKGRLAASWRACAEVEEAGGRALQEHPQLGGLFRPVYVGLGLLQIT